ncbi:murein biosynthesis integral membrane protein MurJ [Streptomyces kanamyceticus]|uniref:Murein biosynthesis integral membrane protein MurJ n=1 Tax=Streptomyces kanamyceticus TaxID=1967 RepID=A0A5J6GCB0_STRKN|nr:murein biosynthesis integral membrane protein MurJ [Streptomyces kanamyceticus]QEU93149.1 murein biosynthesis integral membrane protein MurJ [Streptomyces kanamyceticus]
MNAPYDGDRGQGAGGSASPGGPPPGSPEHGQVPPQPAPDMYLQDAYDQDPYRAQDLSAQDPVNEALYDRAAHPPPPPGTYQQQQPLYAQPPSQQHAPDPRVWAQTPAPEPEGPTRHLPYGDDARTTQFVGVDDLVTQAGEEHHEPDAFAHLFRDQQPGGYRNQQAPYQQGSYPQDSYQQGGYQQNGYPQGEYQQTGYQQDGYQQAAYQQDGYPQANGSPQGNGYQQGGGYQQDGYAQGNGYPQDNGYQQPVNGGYSPAEQPGIPAPAAASAPTPAPAPPAKSGGRASSLLKSSAVMAAGTLVSRLTGFIRSALIVSALGVGLLGDTFQVVYQIPTMIYILTVGGGLNSVFVPQLVHSMKEDEDGGEAFANRLLTLVMVALGVLTVLGVVLAPQLVRLMSVPVANDPAATEVGTTLLRYFLPSIFFMGVHVVMGQILNVRGKFGAMMWTPVLNNVVIIFTLGMFIWVYGSSAESGMTVNSIPPQAEKLLGIGILLGLIVQALAMIPYLRETGFRLRPRFDWKGHGLGKSAKLAKWTILFVLANQAGALVVTQLATAATTDLPSTSGIGFAAYANAQLIWGLPQAIITVSLMAALLPRLSRSAHDGDTGSVRDDISQGLRTTAVAIVPIAFGFVALGIPMCTLIFGSSGSAQATNMGFMLMAFGLGLIPYSVQYVVLRAFYAYEDTRTPFYNTVIVAAVNAAASGACYVLLPTRWAVTGMAAVYGVAYAIGVGIAWRRLRKRLGGDLDGAHVLRTYARLGIAALPAALLGGGVAYAVTQGLGQDVLGSLAALIAGGAVLLGVFFIAAKRMRIAELNSMVGMVRGRLGR